MPKQIIILGAGISGLASAWRLSEQGFKVDVFESSSSVGGLAGTMRQNGYCLDTGPHSFFSDDQKIVETVCGLMDNKMQSNPRKVKFFYKGKYMDYPLCAQGVLLQMGFGSGLRALGSFLKNKIFAHKNNLVAGEDETVQAWAIANFGEYLYQTFFKPYTEQFWKVPCTELSSRSIPTHTRMSFMNTLKLLLNYKVNRPGNSLVEREMRPTYYPDTGFAEIPEQIARRIETRQGKIHLSCEATAVTELGGGRMRVAYLHNGRQEELEADYVISTLPLSLLAKMLNPCLPEQVLASANKLEYRSLVVLGMLTQKQKILNCGYTYLLNRPFNRIFEMNEFSPKTSFAGENILAVEIPCLSSGPIWRSSKDELFNMCIGSLSEDGFIAPGDVKELFLVKAQHAYPIYRKDYAGHLTRLLDYLQRYKSLATLGRCGEFMYMDIDECMKRAFDFVDKRIPELIRS
jgi:protoporphyrinogen oxidase